MSDSTLLSSIFLPPTAFFSFSLRHVYPLHFLISSFLHRHPPRAMPAATAAAETPAAVVLLSKDHVAFGRVVEIASLERLGGKSGEARVGGWGHG